MRRALAALVGIWAMLGGLLLIAIVLVTTTNTAAFILDKLARLWGGSVAALPGYEDFVGLASGVAALTIFPYCQLRRGHVAVDIFVARMPAGLRLLLGRLWLVAALLTALFLAYWMWLGMFESRADNAISRVLGWSEWPFYAPGIVSLLLWAAVAGMQIAEADPDG